jgi:methionyl-tRNA formyltransferase
MSSLGCRLKVLLVTCEITHVPRNFLDFFDEILKQIPEYVSGLVVLDYVSLSHLTDILGLYAGGAYGMASTLALNTLSLPLRQRERLFKKNGLPVIKASTMNSPEIVRWVKEREIDLIVNLRTMCIYNKEILCASRLGCLNIHHGLLPNDRGMLCDLQALAAGRSAGFSIHKMNAKIDDGEIYDICAVSNPGERDYISFLGRTARLEAIQLARVVREIASTGRLPSGRANSPTNLRQYHKPSTLKDLISIKRSGIRF